jgi:ketosteroid isomerase-like protein
MFMARITCILWLLPLLTAGCVSGPGFGPERVSGDVERVEERVRSICDAVQKRDLARLDSYHYYGPKFSKFDASSPNRMDADAASAGEHAGIIRAQNLSLQTHDLKVDLFGNTAVVTCILESQFRLGNQPMQRQSRTTFVMVKEHGDWFIVHEHLSPITP